MSSKAAITVQRPREEAQRLWRSAEHRLDYLADAEISFVDAPGDRGTEIHVDLEQKTGGGLLGEVIHKLTGSEPLAKAKDDLRRFKQKVETGEVPRSDAVPEGELAERKIKQRPAQPLADSELQKVGV
ncbi:MAG: cyclase/dehydrase [Solirubrobacterales bacterium]|jgi:uncharacterized membrane protein|nr:cyclase/dehydrase [Solirubrobacterales bacterium]